MNPGNDLSDQVTNIGRLSRRQALRGLGLMGALGVSGAIFVACGSQAAPTPVPPTTAPGKPATTTPAQATTAPATAPTSAAQPTAAPTAAPAAAPAAAPTVAPAATGMIGSASAKTVITVWHTLGGGPDLTAFRSILTSYTKANTDVAFKLSFVPGSSATGPYVEKITAAIASGSPPDIFHMNRPPQFGAAGALYALDDFIKADKNFNQEDFFPAPWQRVTWLGKAYGVPVIVDSRGYWMNKKLFQEAGLDPSKPPATWDDLITVEQKLSQKDSSGHYTRFGFTPLYGNAQFYSYLYLAGGQLQDANYKVTFNDDHGVQALEWLIKATDATGGAQIVNTFENSFATGANDPFLAGLVASKIDGCFGLSVIHQYAPNFEFAVAPEPFPAGGHKATMVGGYNWSIAKQSKHAQESYNFLSWFSQPAQAVIFAQASANMPARRSALNSDYIQKNPEIKFFFDALSYGVPYSTAPWSQVMWDNVNVTATQDALYKRKSPKEALDAAASVVQAEVDKWINQKN